MKFRQMFLAGWLTVGMTLSAVGAPRLIKMQALPGLAYDVKRFQVKPGEAVRIEIKNTDAMMHNLAIVMPGARGTVVQAALELGADGPDLQYVPRTKDVLWFVPVLEPGQEAVLEFRAPATEGVYPYVCTYPGHGFVMFGAMYVGTDPMPPEATDPNLPVAVQSINRNVVGSDTRVVREFMPDCGPAAIAIGFPNQTSVCWDAGIGKPRYAWHGGFFKIAYTKNDRAQLMGTRWITFEKEDGLRIGPAAESPTYDFHGYRLVEGLPHFLYRLNDVEVEEAYAPLENGRPGFSVTYSMTAKGEPIVYDGPGEIEYQGQRMSAPFQPAVTHALQFSVIHQVPVARSESGGTP